MDEERKRAQEEANAWQKTSVTILRRARIGVATFCILTVAWLFVKNIGFPRDVEEMLPSCVITESGEVLSCEVNLKGKVTNYPFKEDEYSLEDYVTVWFGDQWLLGFEYYHGTFDYTHADTYLSGDTVVGIMGRKLDVLVVELDVKTIFPERDSQRCVLVAPARNEAEALELLRQVSPEKEATSFEWVKKITG